MASITTENDIIYLSGEVTLASIRPIWEHLSRRLSSARGGPIRIDCAGITAIDSAGIALFDEISTRYGSNAAPIQFINIPASVQQAWETFSTAALSSESPLPTPGFFESLGTAVLAFKTNFMMLLYLIADIFYWSGVGLVRRKGQRRGSFIHQSVLIGVNALLIVGLISFLIGLVLALQSAAQLRQFGANIFVADLIGIAMLREMGPIMTAIVVAGRSGSAIASEIATMVVTEEIDALKTMSLNPIRYVVVPKFHGITLTMPLLTILSDLIGILGGFVIGITYLQLSATAFFNELVTVLFLKDLLTGLLKSVVFAWIIIIVACYCGLRVIGGSEGVGKATTASVVASIFFVIMADSILGLIFYFE